MVMCTENKPREECADQVSASVAIFFIAFEFKASLEMSSRISFFFIYTFNIMNDTTK